MRFAIVAVLATASMGLAVYGANALTTPRVQRVVATVATGDAFPARFERCAIALSPFAFRLRSCS